MEDGQSLNIGIQHATKKSSANISGGYGRRDFIKNKKKPEP